MSNYDINSNPALVKQMIENSKKASEKYFAEHPDSLIPPFEQELRDLGFRFEISEQIKQFLPKHKKTILPIAIKYYRISFSGSVCISHDMGGWYSVVLKGKQGILKDTLIERYMNDADNSRVWMPFAFNRIYSAGSDIVLQYEFIQLTPGTQLNGAVYNLTIIALD